MRITALFLCLVVVGCGPNLRDRERDYVASLQARREVNDFHRKILVARCGQIIDVWQAAIDADSPSGPAVTDFANAFSKAKPWEAFREERQTLARSLRALADPPTRYRAQYEKALRQHGYIARLQALVEQPSGSLTSYVAEVRSLAGEYDQLKAELDASLDEAPANSTSKQHATRQAP